MAQNKIYLILQLDLWHSDFSFSVVKFLHLYPCFVCLVNSLKKNKVLKCLWFLRASHLLSESEHLLFMLGSHATGTLLVSLFPTLPLPFWSTTTCGPLLFSEYFISSFDQSPFGVDFYNVIYPWFIVCFHRHLERSLCNVVLYSSHSLHFTVDF